MNTIAEFEVNAIVEQVAEQPKAIVAEIDINDLALVGGGLVSPCHAFFGFFHVSMAVDDIATASPTASPARQPWP